MTYAVIKTGGKQYRVTTGDKILVEKLAGNIGDTVTLKEVLLVGDKVGSPLVANAAVEAKILNQDKGEKITVLKYKRRKNYRRKIGHRQDVTKLEIVQIKA